MNASMSTEPTSAPKSTDYVYVKDLPDAGGLRAGRMKQLRETIEGFKANGYRWVVVRQSDDGGLLYNPLRMVAPESKAAVVVDPYFREVYDTTLDLASQFAEKRAVHW